MNISDEAVEAAAKAIWKNARIEPWEDAHDYIASEYRNDARIALEAAAPYLMAEAWEEGGRAAIEREHTYGREEKAKFTNPYRSQA